MEFNLTPAQWALGILAGVIAGASKTGVPGIGILVAVMLPAIFPSREAIGATVPILIFADLFAVRWYSRYTRWDKLTELMPSVVVGMVVGAVVLFALGESSGAKVSINLLIGIVVLAMIVIYVLRLSLGNAMLPTSKPVMRAIGAGAGLSTTVSNAAGPLMSIYMTSLGLEKTEFMGTSAWYFFIFNLTKIPMYLLLDWLTPAHPLFTLRGVTFAALMFPAVLVGVFVGRWLLTRVSQKVFNIITIVGASLGALRLIWMSLGL
ncbi:MAG: sulfite exporter TauE/SafE family protein [Chloroflexi bacterium]|nr:sulfite exporter TauE/SafE family protein [Chloroflexota bacterium]